MIVTVSQCHREQQKFQICHIAWPVMIIRAGTNQPGPVNLLQLSVISNNSDTLTQVPVCPSVSHTVIPHHKQDTDTGTLAFIGPCLRFTQEMLTFSSVVIAVNISRPSGGCHCTTTNW